jgi:hypothetical protein
MRGFRQFVGRAQAGAAALLVFAASACTFANEPYQIPSDLLPKGTTTTTVAPVVPACLQRPRGGAADAVMGTTVFVADGSYYTLSLRTGGSAVVDVPGGDGTIDVRPGLAVVRSGVYGVAEQQNILVDYVSGVSVGLDLLGWTISDDVRPPVLGSFDENVVIALEKNDSETGELTVAVGAVSLDGLLQWVVTTGVSQEGVPIVRPSQLMVNPQHSSAIIIGTTEATPVGQYSALTVVKADGSIVARGEAWPADGSVIVGWWDRESVVIEDVATGLRVVAVPFAEETEPFGPFADIAFQDLYLAGDGESALIRTDAGLSLTAMSGSVTWSAVATCQIQIAR